MHGIVHRLSQGACGYSETAAPQGGVFGEENHGRIGSPSCCSVQWLWKEVENCDSVEESVKLVQEAIETKLLRCCNPACGKPGYRKTLKLCGRCKLTRYCSRDCQIQHWSVGHKKCCGHDVYSEERPDGLQLAKKFLLYIEEHEQHEQQT
uniref:MYND-type domain-containing protein n=1 Tax=Branchiostoma floridae TaxID=7739 RepID=C3ZSZ9_BRAFL|eukprot:XP_002588333.1 hypothetical protein BRAFLDRAFT_81472 [Branchiostoma floridae]